MKTWAAGMIAALALIPIGVTTYASAREPTPLRALLLEEVLPDGVRSKPAITEVWAFVPLGDCRIGAVNIDSLNRLHARPDMRVIGVLLDVPSDSAQATRLARSFGSAFPLIPDVQRRYARALAREGREGGAVAIVERGRITALFARSPDVLSIAALGDAWSRTGAAGAGDGPAAAQLPAGRKAMAGHLVLERSIVGTAPATLQRPELFARVGGVVAVYDYGDRALKAFALDGTHRWTYRDPNGGARPFENPMDLRVTAPGQLLVVDVPSYRVTIVDTTGALVRSFRLARPVDRVAALSNGQLLGFQTPRPGVLGFRFDSAGALLGQIGASSAVAAVHPMARASYVSALPGTNAAAVVFAYSDYVTIAGADGTVREFHGVEPVAFPDTLSWKDEAGNTTIRISPSAVTGALGVDADGDRIYVLFGGRTPAGWRLIDVYRRRDAVYEGTYTLPEPATALQRIPNGFLTLHGSPSPKINVWHITRR